MFAAWPRHKFCLILGLWGGCLEALREGGWCMCVYVCVRYHYNNSEGQKGKLYWYRASRLRRIAAAI